MLRADEKLRQHWWLQTGAGWRGAPASDSVCTGSSNGQHWASQRRVVSHLCWSPALLYTPLPLSWSLLLLSLLCQISNINPSHLFPCLLTVIFDHFVSMLSESLCCLISVCILSRMVSRLYIVHTCCVPILIISRLHTTLSLNHNNMLQISQWIESFHRPNHGMIMCSNLAIRYLGCSLHLA